eukprot:967489-Rhodomonas_salina.3
MDHVCGGACRDGKCHRQTCSHNTNPKAEGRTTVLRRAIAVLGPLESRLRSAEAEELTPAGSTLASTRATASSRTSPPMAPTWAVRTGLRLPSIHPALHASLPRSLSS